MESPLSTGTPHSSRAKWVSLGDPWGHHGAPWGSHGGPNGSQGEAHGLYGFPQGGHMLLHETAGSWMRVRLAETIPARPWLETREQYDQRLKSCYEAINRDCDVEGLCRRWMKRIQELEDNDGDRLDHSLIQTCAHLKMNMRVLSFDL